ncbi:TPA: hypothetical protein MI868_18270 [Klebsiella pneumoniae]|nr:hypothetical protein [Klebsiella pneumoniae]
MSQRGFYGISIFMNGITNIFLRGVGIMSKMFALLLLSAWLRPCAAQGNELVMATTFSPHRVQQEAPENTSGQPRPIRPPDPFRHD